LDPGLFVCTLLNLAWGMGNADHRKGQRPAASLNAQDFGALPSVPT